MEKSFSDPQSLATDFVVGRRGIRGALGIEAPDTARLVGVQVRGQVEEASQALVLGVIALLVDAVEEATLPLAALGLFDTAQLALGILDAGLVRRDGIHVALLDVGSDVLPGASALVQILLFGRGQGERGGLVFGDNPPVNDLLGAGILDREGIGPLAVDGVEGLLFAFVGLVEACGEGVLLSAEPALTGEIDLGDVAAGTCDLGGLLQLHKRRAVDQRLDVQIWEGNQVFFLLISAGRGERVQSVTNLLHLDGAGEGGFLGIIALKL